MGSSTVLRRLAVTTMLVVLTSCGDDSSESSAESSPDGASESSSGDAGGSFADQSVEDILAAAQEDIEAEDSVHIGGTVVTDGAELGLDLAISRGGDCSGKITQQGAELEVLAAQGRLFVRPDQAFFELSGLTPQQAERAVRTMGSRWIEGDPEGYGALCDLEQVLADEDDSLIWGDPGRPGSKVSAEGTSQVAGVDAVEISGLDGGEPTSVFIAVEDPHVLVRVFGKGEKSSGDIAFTDWGTTVGTEVPAKSEIFVPPNS
jgi:hypothetical protein